MIHYILKDMAEALQYLPYGLAAGATCAMLLVVLNAGKKDRNKPPLPVVRITGLAVYAAIILCITFLSRELGSRVKTIDMQLFSTWGKTDRTHAFVIENILLFVPYGYLLSWNLKRAGGWFAVTLLGALCSLGIESMQFITGRGYFQIDDVLMNTLGMLIGAILYAGLHHLRSKLQKKGQEKKVHADV